MVFILIITLFYRRRGYEYVQTTITEGFESGLEPKPEHEDAYLLRLEKIDLRKERDKMLQELERVDRGAHEYPSNATRSAIRVGLERAIAEIDRALEQEGRFLEIQSLESIVHSIQRNLQLKN